MKNREKLVLSELVKNGRYPDRQMAQHFNMSQPTVTRIRQNLEKRKFITGYSTNVDLKKIGISIVVMTIFKLRDYSQWGKFNNGVKTALMANKEIVTVALGEGFGGKNGLLISAHENFLDYEKMLHEI